MLNKFLSIFSFAAIFVSVISIASASEVGLAAQISNDRGVKVTVIPQSLSQETKTWDFEVTLETHIQPLSDDMARASTLFADGKQYAPLSWDGALPGGHHRKGLLRFKAITPQPISVELHMRLSGESEPRNFRWTLKGVKNVN